MAHVRIEMDRGNGWTTRQEGHVAATAADLAKVLPGYALQYPHRAWLDGRLVAEVPAQQGDLFGCAKGGREEAPSTAAPVFLVQCVSQKGDDAAAARDLYTSDWFKKARAYVESQGGRWFILSALHGLVRPDEVVAPYDLTLNDLPKAKREAWGRRVAAQLSAAVAPDAPVVILAGRNYRDPLQAWAGDRAAVPMEGLGIGQQKAWLARQVAA